MNDWHTHKTAMAAVAGTATHVAVTASNTRTAGAWTQSRNQQ